MDKTATNPDQRPGNATSTSTWITPTAEVKAETIACSAIENICPQIWPTPTFFFPSARNEDPSKQYSYLARGLSRLLDRLPFLTGILTTDERGAWSLEIPPSPQAGVLFHYSDLSGDPSFPTFSELRRAGFPFADGNLDGLAKLRPEPFPMAEDGCPAFFSQLTHLHGGFVLTVSFSHLIGDLVLLHEICGSWANEAHEAGMAATEGRMERPVPSPVEKALTDRTRLSPPCSGTDSWGWLAQLSKAIPAWTLVDPNNPAALDDLKSVVPPAYITPSLSGHEEHLRTTICGVWHFPAASLKAIHSAAENASPHETRISTMDAFISHIWQRFFMAKYAPATSPGGAGEGDATHVPSTSQIVFALDVRRFLNPPMPKGYLPACVDLGHCSAPMRARGPDSPPEKGEEKEKEKRADAANLATLATSIRASITSWSESKYHTLLSLSRRAPASPGFAPRGPIDLLVTDHSRVASVRQADWGPGLGVASAYREPYVGRTPPSGEVTVLPRCADGGIEVMISGERVVLERLRADVGFVARGGEVFVLGHEVGATREEVRARL